MRPAMIAAAIAMTSTTAVHAQSYATQRGSNDPSAYGAVSGGTMVYTPDSVRRSDQRSAERAQRGGDRDGGRRDRRPGVVVGFGVPVTVSAGYLGPQQDLSPYGGGYQEGFVPQVPYYAAQSGSPAEPNVSPCQRYSGPATAARMAAQAPSAFRDGC